MRWNTLKEFIKRNWLLYSVLSKVREFYLLKIVKDENYLKRKFKKRVLRELDLITPKLYNDKIQWLKLYWRDPVANIVADKYRAREFVKQKIGEQYLNKMIAIFDSVDEINLGDLPNRFVLKTTHDSGTLVICYDKNQFDFKKAKKFLKERMQRKYYATKKEYVYEGITPKIICEKYLEQDDSKELRDYRFFCFNGNPKFIAVDLNINNKKETRRNLYDLQWNLMNAKISYPRELKTKIKKPEKLNEMIELSKKLSKGFPHSRVDFYYINNKIIFGEITFFHQSGMGKIEPTEFEEKMGDWLEISHLNH